MFDSLKYKEIDRDSKIRRKKGVQFIVFGASDHSCMSAASEQENTASLCLFHVVPKEKKTGR